MRGRRRAPSAREKREEKVNIQVQGLIQEEEYGGSKVSPSSSF